MIAFVLVQWPVGILPKWIALLVGSAAVTAILVELVLGTPLTRVLVGARVAAAVPRAARPVTRSVDSPRVVPPAVDAGHARSH